MVKNKCLKCSEMNSGPMRPIQVHKPINMNKHHLQSRMNCILIGKTPGAVIFKIIFVQTWPNLIMGGFFP